MEEKTRTLIPLNYFFDSEIIQKEKTSLFASSWVFACFKRELANDGDYYTFDFLDTSIVIRNFSGQLRAFQNVCLHRFSKICLQEKGHGLLQCPYHGWTYNENGEPYAIPSRKTFVLSGQMGLKKFAVATVGEFVFLRLSFEGDPIEEFFDKKIMDLLLLISDALGDKIDVNTMTIEANWKVVVENTLEAYHVRQVHPESLYPVEIKNSYFDFSGNHSSALMEFGTKLEKNKKLATKYAERLWKVNDYLHQLIFPAFTIASAFGATISMQSIVPLSSTKTQFTSHVFATKLPDTKHALIEAFNAHAIDFNRRVFKEDKIICEAVQEGIMQAGSKKGFFSTLEERVWFFEKAYMEFMGNSYD